eukprot:TRINITY_DN31495_c0_g2_i1.p1 TRINITY_DN31495_c0_g2~~TRINITY_DN31495_c0_g2_i1.p1  ORF type:complete len:238 (-),score=44.79 TRINITY_DN31495_c0_g2_i1:142-855(-)
MGPLSARRRNGEEAAAVVERLKLGNENITAIREVAMTPRTLQPGVTPRPVVRGPQGVLADPVLGNEEEVRVERVFASHDKSKTGEVDLIEFHAMCEKLELPLDRAVAEDWLHGHDEGSGLTLEDFKHLYGKILAAQSPAVRTVASRKPLRLHEYLAAESHMRQAFDRHAEEGLISVDNLPEVLQFLGFPDVYGDKFDRFVGEWVELHGKSDEVNFHEFINCVNLLVEFCERTLEKER